MCDVSVGAIREPVRSTSLDLWSSIPTYFLPQWASSVPVSPFLGLLRLLPHLKTLVICWRNKMRVVCLNVALPSVHTIATGDPYHTPASSWMAQGFFYSAFGLRWLNNGIFVSQLFTFEARLTINPSINVSEVNLLNTMVPFLQTDSRQIRHLRHFATHISVAE